MLTVIHATNQHGWSNRDHELSDERLSDMIGKTYSNLGELKREAQKLAVSYPTVEYHDGRRRYRYDGSPTGIPGRHTVVVRELGPL
jgi:hypothetical protein